MTLPTDRTALANLLDGLQEIVADTAREGGAAGTPRVELTRPNDEKFGDFATNVALMLAPLVGSNPRAVATGIAERARGLDGVASVDVAGPGFINVVLDDGWYLHTLASILHAGDRFGSGVAPITERLQVEYVSANPLGPMVAVSARHAAFGDALTRLLTFAGHEVETEHYVNDAGRQVRLFGESILARATGGEVPEGGYQGDYVRELAERLDASEGDDPAVLGRRGVEEMLAIMRPTLDRFGARFDRFQSERELHDSGIVEQALEQLDAAGQLYEEDGATFLRTSTYGDDKDRAVRRSNGELTYFAADIGYLLHKYRRGYDRVIYVLGADHHGYIARLRAAAAALGYDIETCEVVVMQMVSLLEGGEARRMSKRRGDFVTMDEVVDRIGVDATRYFMLQRSHDQSLDLDLDLAAEEGEKNPVWYVKYAHARLCSILRRAADRGVEPPEPADFDPTGFGGIDLHASERRLVKRLAEFPVLVREASERRSPHKLTHFALDVARDTSAFYRDCKVVGDDVDPVVTQLRLQLVRATRTVLATNLDLIGIEAPSSMETRPAAADAR